jgi:hypothetical protein
VSSSTTNTDISGMVVQAYYRDDATPLDTQCTGDSFEYGAAGTAITSAIPNTDPTLGAYNTLTATRWNVYVPATEPADVATRVANLGAPLTTSVATFAPGA